MIEVAAVHLETMLARMCAEYLEMPGLCLTARQAQRFWGLDEQTCTFLLNTLVDTGFLRKTRNGTFARSSDGPATVPDLPAATNGPIPASPNRARARTARPARAESRR